MTVKDYLKANNISMYQAAKNSTVSESTINSAANKSVDKMSVRVLIALAAVTNMTAGELLDDMLKFVEEI